MLFNAGIIPCSDDAATSNGVSDISPIGLKHTSIHRKAPTEPCKLVMQSAIDIEFALPSIKNGYSYRTSGIVGTSVLPPKRLWAYTYHPRELPTGPHSHISSVGKILWIQVGEPPSFAPTTFCTLNTT